MKILAIESAASTASVALWSEGIIEAEFTVDFQKTHSQTLLPMIDGMMKMVQAARRDLAAVAVSSGPGSFTGLRIGAATAKGICQALNIPLIPVSTLEGMAFQCFDAASCVCPMMDARRKQVYTGLYHFEEGELVTVIEPCALGIEELAEKLLAIDMPVLFLGDAAPLHQEYLKETLRVPVLFAPAHAARQRAGALAARAVLLMEEGRAVNAEEFAPEYLRPSQAERVRAEKEAAERDG